ncbi:antibiotic biosynthesis monooxygenase [Nonomuraea monospora]|uniref:Antibiotic biosynthesis monooxygenase n=1 Tax=Nonomuraea monospora TaxID=568818 RepID=A0ABN3C5D6_9ACTN
MTFRVFLRMQIRPGLERDFERTWLDVGHAVTSHPANLGQWLARSGEEEGVYFVISDWLDEPRFREFERSPAHREHRAKLHPYRSSGSMITMRLVHALPGQEPS